jgi:hypothetical protein
VNRFLWLRQNWGRGGLLFLLLALALPAQARPQVVVVIADHLTLSDVTRSDLPGLALLRNRGSLALMSPGAAHAPDPVATVFATLGAGDSIAVGAVSQGRMDAVLGAFGKKTALIGNADGDDTGSYEPACFLIPFPNVTLNPTLPDPLAPGGQRTDPKLLWRETQTALRGCDFVVVHWGDFDRLEREQQQGDPLPSAFAWHRQQALQALSQYLLLALPKLVPSQSLFLVVPTPPLDSQGSWDQLTPLLSWPGDSQTTLTSDTTQTVGLVAARDLAPTWLHRLNVPIPVQMTGAVVHWTAVGKNWTELVQMDRQTRLNQDAQIPLFWGIGLLAPALIFPLIALYAFGRLAPGSRLCRMSSYVFCLLSAWPLALLLAPLVHPMTLAIYLVVIALLTALLALLPSPMIIFSLTALTLIADGFTGTHLVSQSVLSSYALAGIRFYGIGNEYMGLLIGGGLLAASALGQKALTRPGKPVHPLPNLGEGRRGTRRGEGQWVTALWFALIVFVLSFPAFGAKAGGAVTATATFVLAWLRLRGVPIRVRHVCFGVIAGFLMVFVWAWLGDVLHLRRTHLETAVGALHAGRFGYILGIAVRKLGLAARVFEHGGTLLGILALVIMAGVGRFLLRSHLTTFYAARPSLAAVSEAGLWGCALCVVFNDSGIVAAILLLMCLILPVLHGLFGELCASSPSMSAMSASESPSATR